MDSTDLVLHQFAASHYNEKVRWALDYKQLPHRRETYLPGPHQGAIRALSGATSTPVLQLDGQAIAGSAAIIDALEARWPSPALYPEDPTLRADALAWQTRWDAEVGPATRTLFFAAAIRDLGYIRDLFGSAAGPLKRAGYGLMLHAVRPLMARANGADDPATIAAARAVVQRALDALATATATRETLVGDAFGIADLTCAALLLPVLQARHPLLAEPVPPPPAVAELRATFAGHPAAQWAHRQFERQRPTRSTTLAP